MKVQVVVAKLALAPVPEVDFVLQVAGLVAAIGSVSALPARRHDTEVDTWRIMTVRATLGLFVGVGIVAGLFV